MISSSRDNELCHYLTCQLLTAVLLSWCHSVCQAGNKRTSSLALWTLISDLWSRTSMKPQLNSSSRQAVRCNESFGGSACLESSPQPQPELWLWGRTFCVPSLPPMLRWSVVVWMQAALRLSWLINACERRHKYPLNPNFTWELFQMCGAPSSCLGAPLHWGFFVGFLEGERQALSPVENNHKKWRSEGC